MTGTYNGKLLRTMREKTGLSQWHVAKAIGKTQGWLSNVELGYVELTEDQVLNIAAAIRESQAEKKAGI